VDRILIVEPDQALQQTFCDCLAAGPRNVTAVGDLSAALKALDGNEFDLIITDTVLPSHSGMDLLRTVKQRGLATPVILITSQPRFETAAEGLRWNAFEYLAKPVDLEDLERVARHGIQHKQLMDERNNYALWMDLYRRDLEAIFNSVEEGIVTVTPDMALLQVNAAARRMLGLSGEENLTGRPFDEVMPFGFETAKRTLEETLRTRRSVADRRVSIITEEEEERLLVVKTTPLISNGDQFSGALLMIRDITKLMQLERRLEDTQQYGDMIGKSARMQEIFALVKQVAETDSTALVCGESGTGKELVAAALHHASSRAQGPFIKVNCAALSEDLLESELFGHVRGAFTGAVRDRIGRFEAAHGGTILLDEIGDISPRLQLRLLRVLQDREFERVGDTTSIRTEVRVIACTNQNLPHKIRQGEFRQDLYYRLNVVRIELPPLRERLEDIPLLIDHFRRRFNRVLHKEIVDFAPETLEIFMRHPWPGNVRELENTIERAFIVCRDASIQPHHLPDELHGGPSFFDTHGPTAVSASSTPTLTPEEITSALRKTDWNIAKTARILGVARNTVYDRIHRYGLERPAGL